MIEFLNAAAPWIIIGIYVAVSCAYLSQRDKDDEKHYDKDWLFSIFTLGVITAILLGSKLIGIRFTDATTRTLGILILFNLPILAVSTMHKVKNK